MAKIPIQPVVDMVKKVTPIVKQNAPKVMKIIKENPQLLNDATKAISNFVGKPNKYKETAQEYISNKKEKSNNKFSYRKIRYNEYYSTILPKLQESNFIQLKSYINEVNSFIRQFEDEKNNNYITDKLNNKRIADWQKILNDLENAIHNKSYEELLRLYHTKDTTSGFFEEKTIMDFRNITNKEDLLNFIKRYTKITEKELEQDFY